MKKQGLTLALLVVAALVLTGLGNGATAATTKLRATLTAAEVVPTPRTGPTAARGGFRGVIVKRGKRTYLTFALSFQRLSSSARVAAIHLGRRGSTGPVLISLCVAPASPCGLSVNGARPLTFKALRALKNGTAYIMVQTREFPRGEIRGQIKVVR